MQVLSIVTSKVARRLREFVPASVVVVLLALVGVAGAGAAGCLPKKGASDLDNGGERGRVTDGTVKRWGRWQATPGNFVFPRGIAVGTVNGREMVVVTDKTLRVQAFSTDGDLLHVFAVPTHDQVEGTTGFPVGLGISPISGDILLANTHYNELTRLSPIGECIQRLGKYGTAAGEFIYPARVIFSPDGGFYASQFGLNQHRIHHYAPDGRLIRMFGHYGDGSGEFDRPNGLCLDSAGNLYVTDANNSRIQVFSPEGQFLYSFGQFGDGPDGLMVPYGICYDARFDRLIVAEFGASRLSVFARDGRPLGKYTAAELSNPWDVGVSAEFAFVPDYRRHRVCRIPLEHLPGTTPADAVAAPGAPFPSDPAAHRHPHSTHHSHSHSQKKTFLFLSRCFRLGNQARWALPIGRVGWAGAFEGRKP